MASASTPDTHNTEEALLALTRESLALRRRELRYRYIRLGVWVTVIVGGGLWYGLMAWWLTRSPAPPAQPYVALVRIRGQMRPGHRASASELLPALARAFSDRAAKGVVLLIDSPGGSALQALAIYDRIRYFERHYHRPVVAIGRGFMTSGAYLVASAADKVYTDPATVVGFVMYPRAAGGRRPAPLLVSRAEADTAFTTARADIVHQVVKAIRVGRGSRLSAQALRRAGTRFWTASEAVKMGLIDGVAQAPAVLKRTFGVQRVADYAPSLHLDSLLHKLLNAVNW